MGDPSRPHCTRSADHRLPAMNSAQENSDCCGSGASWPLPFTWRPLALDKLDSRPDAGGVVAVAVTAALTGTPSTTTFQVVIHKVSSPLPRASLAGAKTAPTVLVAADDPPRQRHHQVVPVVPVGLALDSSRGAVQNRG